MKVVKIGEKNIEYMNEFNDMQSEKMNASMMSNNAELEEQNNFVEKEVVETYE